MLRQDRSIGSRTAVLAISVLTAVSVTTTVVTSAVGASNSNNLPHSLKPSPAHLIVGPSITIPPALFEAGQPGSTPLVTPSQARKVTTTMWNLWERASIDSNTRALSQLISPGSMLNGTIDNCAYPEGNCVQETQPRPIRQLVPIVPYQTSYPIYFLSEIRTTQWVSGSNNLDNWEPWVELQVLTKSSAKSSWRLSFDTGFNGINETSPALLPFDLAQRNNGSPGPGDGPYNVSPQESTSGPPSQYLPLLAAFWQSYKDTGHAPSTNVFVNDGDTSGEGQSLAEDRQGAIYNGARDTYRFTAEPKDGVWTFSVTGGYFMRCGSILDLATNTAVSGYMNQNPDESNYGIPLKPGYYKKIETFAEHETCIYSVQGGLDAAGDDVYSSNVVGHLMKAAKPAKINQQLSDLETAFGVLVNELGVYSQQLSSCQPSVKSTCTKNIVSRVAEEIGAFSGKLEEYKFPKNAQSSAKSLDVTTRHLTKLFDQVNSTSTNAGSLDTSIGTTATTMARQYLSLLQKLK